MKCKTARAVVLVRQREPLCQGCLEAGVSGKVRALKSNKLLFPKDHVAVAFSGGFSSQVLLCNLLPMRKEAATPRKERGKIEFDLTVLHINEATAYGLSTTAAAAHGQAVRAAALRCGGAASLRVEVVALSDVFLMAEPEPGNPSAPRSWDSQPAEEPPPQEQAQPQDSGRKARAQSQAKEQGPCPPEDCETLVTVPPGATVGAEVDEERLRTVAATAAAEREARLQALLQSVSDTTGREDLLRHLRSRLLAATAARLGVTKLLMGENASAMAARIVSETAKGRGYALPGDIQLVDCRGAAAGEPPVLYPMREVTAKECVYFCRLRVLQPVQVSAAGLGSQPRRSINGLAAAFIESLQANIPSTVFSVLRTAAALRPFPFNAPGAVAPPAFASTMADSRSEGTAHANAACGTGGEAARGDCAHGATSVATNCTAATPGSVGPSTSRAGVPCCMLCRAPLSQREQEAMMAAAVARADSAAQTSTVATCGAAALQGTGRPNVGGEARAGALGAAAEEDEGDDMSAPFCLSCRSQILFAPGHPEMITAGATGAALSYGSKHGGTLALLPKSFWKTYILR